MLEEKYMKIIGLVPVYKPNKKEIHNIEKYVDDLDACYILDDSGTSNIELFKELKEKYHDKIQYFLNKENLGLCKSVNNGYRIAMHKGADWILIMNPDGTFQNNAIDIYKDYINNNDTSNVAIIAPRFNTDRRKRNSGKGIKRIKYADMTGCLYNVKIFNEIGFYDNNTYFYGLDTEMCLRVNELSYLIVECSEAVLNHNPAETYNVKIFGKTVFKCGKDVPQRYYYQFRSAYYINNKYHSIRNILFHIYKITKVILFFDNKKEYFRMIKYGIRDAKKEYFGKYNH